MNGAVRNSTRYLTTEEVSKWLGFATRTICSWAELKEIPAIKIGRQWRFLEGEIRRWLVERMLPFSPVEDLVPQQPLKAKKKR